MFKARHIVFDRPVYIKFRETAEADFQAVRERLSAEGREWLRHAIELMYPGHPWLGQL